MRQMPQDAIDGTRRWYAVRDRPIDDLPDEAVAKMFVAAWVDLSLRLRDLGRAFRASLPTPRR